MLAQEALHRAHAPGHVPPRRQHDEHRQLGAPPVAENRLQLTGAHLFGHLELGHDHQAGPGHRGIHRRRTKITKAGKAYTVKGNLTLHGVTKPVTLKVELSKPVKSPWGQMVRAVKVTGKLNRKDFGLTWNKALEAGGVLVGDEVTLDIRMELNS